MSELTIETRKLMKLKNNYSNLINRLDNHMMNSTYEFIIDSINGGVPYISFKIGKDDINFAYKFRDENGNKLSNEAIDRYLDEYVCTPRTVGNRYIKLAKRNPTDISYLNRPRYLTNLVNKLSGSGLYIRLSSTPYGLSATSYIDAPTLRIECSINPLPELDREVGLFEKISNFISKL